MNLATLDPNVITIRSELTVKMLEKSSVTNGFK